MAQANYSYAAGRSTQSYTSSTITTFSNSEGNKIITIDELIEIREELKKIKEENIHLKEEIEKLKEWRNI